MVMPVLLDEVLEIQGLTAQRRCLIITVELMKQHYHGGTHETNGVSIHGNPFLRVVPNEMPFQDVHR
jgi:hypothetical protein